MAILRQETIGETVLAIHSRPASLASGYNHYLMLKRHGRIYVRYIGGDANEAAIAFEHVVDYANARLAADQDTVA